MNHLTILIVSALLVSGCNISDSIDTKNFDIVNNNVTVWEDPILGECSMILAVEVRNTAHKPIEFQVSNFEIMDENGTVIDTMETVHAYPSVVESGETAVYYEVKTFHKVSGTTAEWKAIPHIEAEISNADQAQLSIKGMTTGGSQYAYGVVKNRSSHMTYQNVRIAVISRNNDNEVISVMTTTIDSIKPQESVNFQVKDRLENRYVGPDAAATYQGFAYVESATATRTAK